MAVKRTPKSERADSKPVGDGSTRFPYDDEVRNPYDDEVKNPHEETASNDDAADAEPTPATRKATRAVSKRATGRRRATDRRADK